MSIATTVAPGPSRILQVLAISFSLIILIAGASVVWSGNITPVSKVGIALLCVFAAVANYLKLRSINGQARQITVSEQGEFSFLPEFRAGRNVRPGLNRRYRLAQGTTLWSNVLFLRLNAQDSDTAINLMIFSDALSKDEFRRISIACRWIVQQSA